MSAKTKVWLSGHCNADNPTEIHRQCDEHPRSDGTPCSCFCHMAPAETTEPTMVGFHDDIPEPDYHAHQGSLSVSGAKTLLKAPALFRWQQEHPVYKSVFDVGAVAHKLVLGVGDPIKVIDADSWRSKAAQEARDTARAAGEIPILAEDYKSVQEMADKLSEHRLATRLLSEGRPEVSAFCQDEATGVVRRSRFDWLGDTILTDYKTARSADPNAFVRAAVDYGYAMQHAWYQDIAADLGHPAKAFAFIVQEKEPPYLVTVVELPAELVDVGRRRNQAALQRFRDCTESGHWPGYVPDDTFAQPTAPAWALREDIPA